MSIEVYMSAVQSWLSKQKERGCEIPVYLTHGACPTQVFLNYDVVDMLRGGIITNKSGSGFARGKGDEGEGAADASMRSYDLSGWPESPEVYKLTLTRRTIAEEEALNDIEFCNALTCLGPCGVTEDVCTDGIITANFTTVGETDVWYTTDGWANGGACNAPFGAIDDEIATAAVCFPISRDTTRHIVGRGTVSAVAAPAEIGYTDDLGAGCTWNQVNVGTTNGEFFQYGGSIWAHNGRNMWAGVNTGVIYFSDDEGLTWTDQGAAAGANAIYSIHFVDENYGMAVGAANAFQYTTDGGAHWTSGTGPAAGDVLTGVRVIDNNRAWVTVSDGTTGELWYTNDFGTTWTQRLLPVVPDALGAIDLIDEYAIAVVGYYDGGGTDLAAIYRTFNGGYNWESHYYDTAFDSGPTYGLNAVKMCSYNHIFAVGEEVDSTGVILELENAQPS
jgi:photosystem II stability/assembly factor-like uncharacterized protein